MMCIPNEMAQNTGVRVHVLLFSVLRERVGTGSLEVMVPQPASGERLLRQLGEQYAAIAAFGPSIRLARNQEYAPGDCPLFDGDEVALITPVSGG